jgi:hypothetical protein
MTESSLHSVISLETTPQKNPRLVDGRISQGMGIVQEGHYMFIWVELGRWPTRHDQLTTLTYSWDLNQFFFLFIPVEYFPDQADLNQDWVKHGWLDVIKMHELIRRLNWDHLDWVELVKVRSLLTLQEN